MKKRIITKEKIFAVIGIIIVLATLYMVLFKPRVEEYPKDLRNNSLDTQVDFIKRNLISGGPPKDGIPSIDNPIYLSVSEAEATGDLVDGSTIFGVNYNGFVAAYPQDILYWHEIVNEEVSGEKISVTYCPLTKSIIGYKGHELGVSGELYNSNLVMYDRGTDSRIPQILGMGIEGDLKGNALETFEVVVTSWKEWKTEHPDTKVLSRKTGFNRDYNRNPYPGYDNLLRVWFPLVAESDELRTKDLVLGIEVGGKFAAIEKNGFKKKYPSGLNLELGGEKLRVVLNNKLGNLEVEGRDDIKNFEVYWFAWYAYHPDTKLFKTNE